MPKTATGAAVLGAIDPSRPFPAVTHKLVETDAAPLLWPFRASTTNLKQERMPESRGNAPSKRKTVLLVDTGKSRITELRAALERADLSVLEAQNAEDALALAESQNVGLAVLCHNGDFDKALALATELFSRHHIHSALLSMHHTGPAPQDVAASGAIGYLPRSVGSEDFARAVHAMISRAEELTQLRINEERMRAALLAERDINTAIGIVMERLHLSREAAFNHLRAYARSHRMRIVEVSRALFGSTPECARITAELMSSAPRTKTEHEPNES